MTTERKATVLAWASWLYSREADAIHYAWPPPTPEQDAEACRLSDEADRIYRRAVEVAGFAPRGPGEASPAELKFWQDAISAFETEAPCP